MMKRISLAWCRTVHRGAMWPMHGYYTCPRCLRKHPVIWNESGERAPETSEKAEDAAMAMVSTATPFR